MIQSQAFVTALPFAARAAEKGGVLVAKPNTVLSELVRLALPVQDFQVQDKDALETYGSVLQATTEGTLDNPTQHSLELDGVIKDISKLVTTHVSHAKNVVKPLVVNMAERISQYMQSNQVKDASCEFSVIPLNIPAVLADESFLDSISYYTNKTAIRPTLTFELEDKSAEDLIKLVMMGHDRTDQFIVEWLSQQQQTFLHDVWVSFFTRLGTASLTYTYIERVNVYDKANYALAVYLIANKLYNEVEGGDTSLTVYRNTAMQVRDYAGSLLTEAIKTMALFSKTKSLIIESNYRNKTIKVNGSVYREWLQAGGSPEVILGVLVSNDQVSSQASVDAKAEEFRRQWESYNAYYKVSETNKSFDYLKAFLGSTFRDTMSSLDESEKAYQEKNPGFYSTVDKLFDELIVNMKREDTTDVYSLALTIVGKCRFYYTSAYSILYDINEAGKINPNVDVREAALIAVINYLADYLANQIAVSQ